MAKKSSKKSVDSPAVVHARVGRESRADLEALCRECGKSSNELVGIAVSEFLEVVAYARVIDAGLGKEYEPDDFVAFLGARWVQRLVSVGLASEGMRLAWRRHLEMVQGMLDDKSDRRAS